MVSPPPIQLANLGMTDSFILMVLALVVFGPRRLPQIGRQIGKLMYEFRKASNDFKFQMEEELRVAEESDRRKKEEEERQRVATLAATSQVSVSAAPQTVEAAADIGAVEAPAASSEPYLPETSVSSSEDMPTIQPPRTGEPVSTSQRPDYYFESSETSGSEAAVVAEVNPEADADANAAGFEAQVAAQGASGPGDGAAESQIAEPSKELGSPVTSQHPTDEDLSPGTLNHPSDEDLSPGTPPKEPVSQHG
jgi:sec-independent protein translocase protein TatB